MEVTRVVQPVNTAQPNQSVPPELQQAAEGMEALFVNEMLRAMRSTIKDGGELSLESPAVKIYRSMLDSEYANIVARNSELGLADLIVDSLSGGLYNREKGFASRGSQNDSSTGGTSHEGYTENEQRSSSPSTADRKRE